MRLINGCYVLSEDPKTDLTLSAAPDLLPEDARVAAAIEGELALIDRLRVAGAPKLAERRLDWLFGFVLGGAS